MVVAESDVVLCHGDILHTQHITLTPVTHLLSSLANRHAVRPVPWSSTCQDDRLYLRNVRVEWNVLYFCGSTTCLLFAADTIDVHLRNKIPSSVANRSHSLKSALTSADWSATVSNECRSLCLGSRSVTNRISQSSCWAVRISSVDHPSMLVGWSSFSASSEFSAASLSQRRHLNWRYDAHTDAVWGQYSSPSSKLKSSSDVYSSVDTLKHSSSTALAAEQTIVSSAESLVCRPAVDPGLVTSVSTDLSSLAEWHAVHENLCTFWQAGIVGNALQSGPQRAIPFS